MQFFFIWPGKLETVSQPVYAWRSGSDDIFEANGIGNHVYWHHSIIQNFLPEAEATKYSQRNIWEYTYIANTGKSLSTVHTDKIYTVLLFGYLKFLLRPVVQEKNKISSLNDECTKRDDTPSCITLFLYN